MPSSLDRMTDRTEKARMAFDSREKEKRRGREASGSCTAIAMPPRATVVQDSFEIAKPSSIVIFVYSRVFDRKTRVADESGF